MLVEYKRRANTFGIVWFVSSIGIISTVFESMKLKALICPHSGFVPLACTEYGNLWSGNWAATTLAVISISSWFYALGCYAKAKRYSAWWALAGLFSVFGLLVLLVLKDRVVSKLESDRRWRRA